MNDLRIRGQVLVVVFIAAGLLFISRLFFLQVWSEDYALKSNQLDMQKIVIRPPRGIIFDRNEKIYVQNSPVFDVIFIPAQLYIPDTTILEDILGLSKEEIRKRISKYPKGDLERVRPQELERQVNARQATRLQERLWEFKGIYLEAKNSREYIYPVGANFLGYINQVNPVDIETDAEGYYQPRDLIGITGIEREYEPFLRGKKGKRIILVDAFHREVGSYADGKLDELPIEGRDIKLGVDAELQAFGEALMRNKKGSIVAIEPATGEILAFVSAPVYDPNLFTGRELGKYYKLLEKDTLKPLFNRPLMAKYPPGSVFKLLQALAAMSDGIITPQTHFNCIGAWPRNKGKPKCHGAHGSPELRTAIIHSCNAYFAETYYSFLTHNKFKDIHQSYDTWWERMSSYGSGHKLGIDIPNETAGNLPTSNYYDKIYGKKSWHAFTVYSNSIGQGEVQMTPLQMANAVALIANRGFYVTPHFVTEKRNTDGSWEPIRYEKINPKGDTSHYNIVVEAMADVVSFGTGTMAQIDSIIVCGKTGTAEDPPRKDHSVFIAFAPKDNPKIAIACIVENAGWGGSWAAPICSLMMEKYLNRKIKNEAKLKRILDADFIRSPASGGTAP